MLRINCYRLFMLFRITFKTIGLSCGLLALLSSCSKHSNGGSDNEDEAFEAPEDAPPEREPEIFAPHANQSLLEATGIESFSGEPFSLRAILRKRPASSFRGEASEIELSYSVFTYGAPPQVLRIRQEIGTWETPAPTIVEAGHTMQLSLVFESPSHDDDRFSSYAFSFHLRIASVSDTQIRGYLESSTYVASRDEASYLLLPTGTEVFITK